MQQFTPYWWLSVGAVLARFVSNIIHFSLDSKKYIFEPESWAQWILVLTMVLTHVDLRMSDCDEIPEWQSTVAAVSLTMCTLYVECLQLRVEPI